MLLSLSCTNTTVGEGHILAFTLGALVINSFHISIVIVDKNSIPVLKPKTCLMS